MSAWSELSNVRKIEVLSHKEPILRLCRFSDNIIRFTGQPLHGDEVDIVADVCECADKNGRDVLVEFDPYATSGIG